MSEARVLVSDQRPKGGPEVPTLERVFLERTRQLAATGGGSAK